MDGADGDGDVKSALFVRGGWEGHEPVLSDVSMQPNIALMAVRKAKPNPDISGLNTIATIYKKPLMHRSFREHTSLLKNSIQVCSLGR